MIGADSIRFSCCCGCGGICTTGSDTFGVMTGSFLTITSGTVVGAGMVIGAGFGVAAGSG